jgi:3-methyl-2-oxobutanoate hydroxymethyltransferase
LQIGTPEILCGIQPQFLCFESRFSQNIDFMITLREILESRGKLVALTCYDYPTALSLDASSADLVLVGDSVGTNVLGYSDVSQVTMDDMLHHARAVRRGLKRALLLVDLPFNSYQTVENTILNAKRLIEAGADMIKIEGGLDLGEKIHALRAENIRVVAHIGHTPQSHTGTRKVFGTTASEIETLLKVSKQLESAGSEAVLLECVPERVATIISDQLDIPTIGIGSGSGCDGQVFVITDLLGWHHPGFRFSAAFDDFRARATSAANCFAQEVRDGLFPSPTQVYKVKDSELQQALNAMQAKT